MSERSYGIDLYKTLGMFMVVLLHVLGVGAVIGGTVPGTMAKYLSSMLQMAAYCAANCFALASGYLMVGRGIKYRKIVSLWVTVFFYSVLFFVIDLTVWESPFAFNNATILFPVSSQVFWYFSAYVGMFFFIPFMNKLIDTLSKQSFYRMLGIGFLLFSLWGVLTPFNTYDHFRVQNGYSMWWLMYLYFLGAGVKKYGLFMKLGGFGATLGYVACVAITFISKFGVIKIVDMDIPYISRLFYHYGNERFLTYVSPTILGSTVFLLVMCMRVKIPKPVGKALAYISPLIFQVYIIHVHRQIWQRYIVGKFSDFAGQSTPIMLLMSLGAALAIFLICLAIDWVRMMLFRLIRVDKLIGLIADKLNAWAERLKLLKKAGEFFEDKIGG